MMPDEVAGVSSGHNHVLLLTDKVVLTWVHEGLAFAQELV
jgi:hypothetical protein